MSSIYLGILTLRETLREFNDMNELLSEQEWVYRYLKKNEQPLPLVLGAKGNWGYKGNLMIILISPFEVDVYALAILYGVSHHPIRRVKYKDIIYYAVNIVDKKQVEKIIEEWR